MRPIVSRACPPLSLLLLLATGCAVSPSDTGTAGAVGDPSEPTADGPGTTPSTSSGPTASPVSDTADPMGTLDDTGVVDSGRPVDSADAVESGTPVDSGTGGTPVGTYVPDDPSTLTAGLAWVRTNRPFISGLAVRLGVPPTDEVDQYYDDFHGTAAHLWAMGLPEAIDGWGAAAHPDHRWLSWVTNAGRHAVSGWAVGDSPVAAGRIGYQVGDEPRNTADVDEMAVGVGLIRQHDPEALVVMNFGNSDGSVGNDELYAYAADTLAPDVLSYSLYSGGHGEYERALLVRDVAMDRGLPYWRYLDSYASADGGHTLLPPDDLRWSAMLGLVYGYSGVSWFLYQTDAFTASEEVSTTLFPGTGWGLTPNEHFDAAAALNLELETYLDTVAMLTSTAVTYEPMSRWYMPDDHEPFTPGTGDDPFLQSLTNVGLSGVETQEWSVGLFHDDQGSRYLMVQNANHHTVSFPLYRPSGTFELSFDFAGAPGFVDPSGLERLDPHTGDIERLPLTHEGGDAWSLQYTLDAGDVVLLKYVDGKPFARRP